jgi:hypothetical protein
VVAFFAVLRLLGMGGDLWLDEIWSLYLVSALQSPVEIATRLLHDNNHPLNSLWLYGLGPAAPEWSYRLPAWLAGSAAVALAAAIARRQLRLLDPGAPAGHVDAAGLLTALLFGGSYLMIHYASEARGYAPAVAASLLAVFALLHAGPSAWRGWPPIYWIACVLGLLAHMTVVSVMAAGLAWSLARPLGNGLRDGPRDGEAGRTRWLRAATWHVPPWLFFAAYALLFARRMAIGGGPPHSVLSILGETAAYTVGIPAALGVSVALPLLAGAVLLALASMWRAGGRALAGFYALAIAVVPPLGVAFSGSSALFPRYFSVPAALALLLLGYALARLWARAGLWRGAVALLVALFLAGNAAPLVRLVRDGRGQYRAALQHVADATPTAAVTVSGDHDFRNEMVIHHYRRVLGPDRWLRYLRAAQVPDDGTHWFFLHRLDGDPLPGELYFDPRGRRYRLDAVFPHAALSGWDWFVYRRE